MEDSPQTNAWLVQMSVALKLTDHTALCSTLVPCERQNTDNPTMSISCSPEPVTTLLLPMGEIKGVGWESAWVLLSVLVGRHQSPSRRRRVPGGDLTVEADVTERPCRREGSRKPRRAAARGAGRRPSPRVDRGRAAPQTSPW